jgi:phosphinothricin acetyltransferase
MKHVIRQATREDFQSILKIFNYYIENTFTAYPDKPIDEPGLEKIIQACMPDHFYVIELEQRGVVGFGLLKPVGLSDVFRYSGEVAYFIHLEYVHMGLGSDMLGFLTAEAKKQGIQTLLASISSLNPISVRFHEKNGFRHCGRFEKVGKKWSDFFDMVWMQKDI